MDRKEFLIKTFNKESISIIDVLKVEYPNAKGYQIKNNLIIWWWEDNQDTQPSESELDSLLNDLKNEWDKYQYARDRVREYPPISHQLDTIYNQGIDGWKSNILAIKTKYPKSE
jgi:hypothetical protein